MAAVSSALAKFLSVQGGAWLRECSSCRNWHLSMSTMVCESLVAPRHVIDFTYLSWYWVPARFSTGSVYRLCLGYCCCGYGCPGPGHMPAMQRFRLHVKSVVTLTGPEPMSHLRDAASLFC